MSNVVTEAIKMVSSGHFTTGVIMVFGGCFCLAAALITGLVCLARHPRQRRRLIEELKR